MFSILNNQRAFWLLLVLTIILGNWGGDLARFLDAKWLVKYPSSWQISINTYISSGMNWLIEDAAIGPISFTDVTRSLAWLIKQPYELVLAFLADGLYVGKGSDAISILPAISWIVVTAAVIALGSYSKDWGLASLVGACFIYLAVFGQWESAMITLASVLISVPIGAAGGLWFGILAYRYPFLDRLISPVLDVMQTIPIFAYLVPILFMFGFGPIAALVATIIYAAPPMVRITTLALKSVDIEIVEFGHMVGTTKSQLMWKVLVPSARSTLMVGVNQVIMLTLNMVIVASMIGAGGLGFDVLSALRRLDIGGGFEAGIAIVVLAIAIDRLSQALAERMNKTPKSVSGSWFVKYKRTVVVLALLVITWVMGSVYPSLWEYPEGKTITTGKFWSDSIKYLNVNFYDHFETFKVFILEFFLLPIKRTLLGIPWLWAVAMLVLISWKAGGLRLALLCGTMSGFIVVTGLWSKAMVTVYLCGASVILATVIGVPLGLLAALNKRAGSAINVLIDTLQTLPSFVYLIPVVMLFRIGDFTAMIAIVLYALAPAVRYAAHGIRSINDELIEAGLVSGCTKYQLLRHIRLPMALPEILLGINQTIMLALSMLVITALVGTRDLGQEVYIALTKADTGRGLVAGLAIAFIAIIADRIVTAGARAARIRYGLES